MTKTEKTTAKANLYGKRLLQLADFLETIPDRNFDMNTFYRRAIENEHDAFSYSAFSYSLPNRRQSKPELSCGSTACAGGWATACPSLRRQGLRMSEDADILMFNPKSGRCVSRDTRGTLSKFFDLNSDEIDQLFFAFGLNRRQEIKNIRAFVAERYGVDQNGKRLK